MLVKRDQDIQMEYRPALPAQVWQRWLKLEPQTNILVADRMGILRYAAIDWTHERLAITDPTTLARFATWGMVLARAYDHLVRHVKMENLAWMAKPLVKFDVEGVMRIGFLQARAPLPPELLDQWPYCDERALVYVVAQTMVDLAVEVPWSEPIGVLLARCLQADPDARYPSLDELRRELRMLGGNAPIKAAPRSAAWIYIEPGIGFLGAGDLSRGLDCFRKAMVFDPRSEHARVLAMHAHQCLPSDARVRATPSAHGVIDTDRIVPWTEARVAGAKLEHEHDVTAALDLYKRARADAADLDALFLARARCQLAIGKLDDAIENARCVLAHDMTHIEARAIEARALLGKHDHTAALRSANLRIAVAHTDGDAYYVRGKALLGLRRLVEARDAFDQACTLAPTLLVALWLRSAVDRSLAHVRATVGVATPMPVDLPLGPLRDALVAGRIDDAITMLETSQLLGDLLSYAGRFEDALRVFDQLDGDAALAGKARALIDLGRTDEALAVLGTLDADADGFAAIRR